MITLDQCFHPRQCRRFHADHIAMMPARAGLIARVQKETELNGSAPYDAGAPVRVIAGHPSYINVLDALGAWELVREAATVLSVPVATTFKHVSPAGVATAGGLDEVMRNTWYPDGVDLSEIA